MGRELSREPSLTLTPRLGIWERAILTKGSCISLWQEKLRLESTQKHNRKCRKLEKRRIGGKFLHFSTHRAQDRKVGRALSFANIRQYDL